MDIAEIKKKLTSLSGEQRKAAIDAVKAILKGKSSSTNSNSSDNSASNTNQSSGGASRDQNSSANKNQSSDSKEQHQPQIGDMGDPESDLRKAEDAYRKANEYKDEAEQKADQAEAEGDFDEANKQQDLADKASELADKAKDLADGDELTSKEQARLKRIQDALRDINIERKIQDETEKAVLNDREVQKRKKAAQKNSTGLSVRSGGLNAFKASIDKFMKDELSYKRLPSWKRPNKRYPEETGIVLRGKARVETKNIPLLVVYFDQSGSWSKDDVQKGLAAIESLNYYVKQHKLKLEIYYFAVNIHTDAAAARIEGGTLDSATLVEDIKKRKPNNVVIMTDSDPDYEGYCPSVTVDGGVWLLFRDNSVSKQLYRNVNGKKLKEVFSI